MSGQNATERFQRSVEADIATAEAEQQAKTNPKVARQLLAYARDLVNEDPEVWYASARFELGQGRQSAALAHYDEALKREPTHAPAAFDRAVLLQEMGRDNEAKTAFESFKKQHADDTRVAYYMGLYALQAGDSPNARRLFDAARQGESKEAAYARAYHALLADQDHDGDAPRLAAEALPTAPNDSLRQRLALLVSLHSGSTSTATTARGQKWIDVRALVSFEVDSNAALAPLDATGINNVTPTDAGAGALAPPQIVGFRLVEDVRLTFRPVALEKFTLELEGAFANANHLNAYQGPLQRYDYASPAGTLRMYSRLGTKIKVELGLEGMYRALFTNAFGTYFFNGFGGSPYVGIIFAPRHALYVLGNIEYRDYVSSKISISGDADYDRDGMTYSGGLFYSVPFWYFDASIGGGYEQESAKGSQYFLRGGRGQAQLRFNYQNTYIAHAYGGANIRVFPKAVAGDATGRQEQRYEVGGGFRYNPLPYLGVAVTYAYTMNNAFSGAARADFPLYTYRRHVGAFSVIGSY